MSSYLPRVQVKVAQLIIQHLQDVTVKRFNDALIEVYKQQKAEYPTFEMGFRYEGKVYALDQNLTQFSTRFARLHPKLIATFSEELSRYQALFKQDGEINDCIYAATMKAKSFSDLFLLLPEQLVRALPDSLRHLMNDGQVMEDTEIQSFHDSHAEQLQWIRERILLRSLTV